MVKLLRNIGLYIFSTALLWILSPLGIIMGVLLAFSFKNTLDRDLSKYEMLANYFFKIALARDQLANVIMQVPLNLIFIKKGGHKFGDEDETISSVLGKNKLTNTLSKTGKLLDRILDFLDDNHTIKSIE